MGGVGSSLWAAQAAGMPYDTYASAAVYDRVVVLEEEDVSSPPRPVSQLAVRRVDSVIPRKPRIPQVSCGKRTTVADEAMDTEQWYPGRRAFERSSRAPRPPRALRTGKGGVVCGRIVDKRDRWTRERRVRAHERRVGSPGWPFVDDDSDAA